MESNKDKFPWIEYGVWVVIAIALCAGLAHTWAQYPEAMQHLPIR